jgi:hypothetical protein
MRDMSDTSIIFHQINRGKIVSKSSHFQMTISELIFPLPEPVVPFAVFLTGYFPVPSGGIEALMPQVLLEEPKTIAGIVVFHGIHCECVPELMRGDVVNFAGFRINEFWQASSFSVFFDNLPCSVAVNAEEIQLAISNNGTAALDVFRKHFQRLGINRQHTLAAVLLLF